MRNVYLLVAALLLTSTQIFAQNVDVFVDVIELTHSYDCGNDGNNPFGDNPEPRCEFGVANNWKLQSGVYQLCSSLPLMEEPACVFECW